MYHEILLSQSARTSGKAFAPLKKLNRDSFDVLVDIEAHQSEGWSATAFAKRSHLSEDTVNAIVDDLVSADFLRHGENGLEVSDDGYRALEPYRVKRAILLAAGLGNRMLPVTEKMPKPLVPVNGTPIIETLIRAIEAKGIEEILIVTGYLNECFDSLKQKHPHIKFLHNDKFTKENNISSAWLARDYFDNAYVLEADLFLRNPDLIRRYEYSANYLGIPMEKSDDWYFATTNGRITKLALGCGHPCYQMVGISYWPQTAGLQFAVDVQRLYKTEKGKQQFWDEVALNEYNANYDIRVRECTASDITEIDSVKELAAIDPQYKSYLKETK